MADKRHIGKQPPPLKSQGDVRRDDALMDENPFLINGPACISFSGGRTSGMMLAKIVAAHGGFLPPDIYVCFANTGKERPETLRFVHDCETHFGVKVNWLEWRDGAPGYAEVGFNSASRAGEPFAALIAKKKRLPNWTERWCTQFLKVEPMMAFLRANGLETGKHLEVIGLRHDEPLRILRSLNNAEFRKMKDIEVPKQPARRLSFPLTKAKISSADIRAFWRQQPFDLDLAPHESNCDLCFMKERGIRKRIIRNNPTLAHWWIEQETMGQWFDRRDRYAELLDEVHRSPELSIMEHATKIAMSPHAFDLKSEEGDEEYDAECDVSCGGE